MSYKVTNSKFEDNKPVYSEVKSSTVDNTPLDNDEGKEIVELQKRHYGTRDASQILDRSFVELTKTRDSLTPETFFNLYRELFYDLPKIGDNSHTLLIKESRDYVKDYIDPKDAIIDELTQKIIDFERNSIEIPSEHPLFPNGTALRVGTDIQNLSGPLGIMQEGRFRKISNRGNPSPFTILKRPLGFIDGNGKLLSDENCITLINQQTFDSLPKFTDPLEISAINEAADWNFSSNDALFNPPASNFTEITTLIGSADLKNVEINNLINTLKSKIPFDGFTIEDNEDGTFTWTPQELAPFGIKGQFQGDTRILDTQNPTLLRNDHIQSLLDNALEDYQEDLFELDISPITDFNVSQYVKVSGSFQVNRANNSLENELDSLIDDIEDTRFEPYIWTNPSDSVKFRWILRTGLGERGAFTARLKAPVRKIKRFLERKKYTQIGSSINV
tara:strand:- start:2619 stop:3956 length:1338 start_codon:yes stop_codon:yes gene_type:complete